MSLHTPADAVEGVPGPLSIPATIGTAIVLYGRDLRKLWLAMAAIIVPLLVLAWLLDIGTAPKGAMVQNGTIVFPATSGGSLSGADAIDELIEVLMTLLSTGVAYRILLGRYLRHPADLRTSLQFALERSWKLLGVAILTIVGVVIGLFLVVVPGIYVAVVLSLVIPVAMAENLGVVDTLSRSRQLLAGHLWRAFICLLCGPVFVGALELAVTDLLERPLLRALTPHSVSGALGLLNALHAVIGILLSPYVAAVPVVLYVDMLLRKRDPQLPALLA